MSRVKIIVVLSLLFVLINISVYSMLKINEKQRIEVALEKHLSKLKSYFEMLIHYQSVTADAAYKSTVNKKEVIEILSMVEGAKSKEERAVLRKKLYDVLAAKYKILKSEGVLQYHFVLPNNRVFLRMHKPLKFGDNLSDIRFSFRYTNSTHKIIRGFEQGRTSHGFRNVYPIFGKDGRYLSSIEISFASDDIQNQLTDQGGIHTHFLVNKQIFDEKAWNRDDLVLKYTQSAENHEYFMTMTKGHIKEVCVDENRVRLKPLLDIIDTNMHRSREFSIYILYKSKSVVASFYPIKNIKDKKNVAWIVSYEDDEFIYMTLKSNIYIEIILFFILLILFYFVYRVFNQKIELNIEIEKKTELLAQNRRDDWIKEGTNGLNARLTSSHDIVSLSNNSVAYLCEYLKAGIGALYIHDRDDDSLHLYGTYAFMRRQELSNVFGLGEGTVGQVALQKTPIQIENIVRSHLDIITGTTSEPPLTTYTFPLLYEDGLYGVIELGSTGLFNEMYIEFFELANTVIATKIFSEIQNEKVKELLLESQETNSKLQKQRSELEDTNTQMQKQQLQLKERNTQMQEQQAELEEANSQMQEQQAQLEEVNSQMQEQQIQLKESEKELRIQNKRLESSKLAMDKKAKALADSNRYKSEFLANMSHELRTPLNSIILLSDMLGQNKKQNLNEDDIKKSKIINSSGEELLRLINDVLDLSKVEAGRMDLNIHNFLSKKFSQKIKDIFEPSANHKGLKFIVSDNYNDIISTDEDKLFQIVKNFISNALKFTQDGIIELIIEKSDSNRVKISVKDSGIGIAKDKHNIIFRAFRQADSSTSRKYGGTGLGLSITKELVKLIGGEIFLDSQEGQGSTFSIVIPNLNRSDTPESKEPQEVKKLLEVKKPKEIEIVGSEVIDDVDNITSDGRVFLIIEDNKTFAMTLKSVINDKGDYALIATTAKKGLELANSGNHIEGILLDLGLPDMDGIDLLKRLKTDIHTKKIPVYIVSGRDIDNKFDIKEAVGFKQKPLSSSDLDSIFDDLYRLNDKEVKDLLIVEDDDIQRETMIEFIANDNTKIEGVDSIESAIEELDKGIYDAVIIDLSLNGNSGLEICEYIKKNNLSIPIIIYTGKSLSADEEREIEKYTDSLIIKSMNSQNRLLQEVDNFLHSIKAPIKKETNGVSADNISLSGKKVMVVDDDMRNIFVLVEILEERGAEVLIASNGKEALELLDDNLDTNIILMNIMMPIMDGYEAIEKIKANSDMKDIPIIAVTAKSMPQDREKSMKVGADDCLTKPLNLNTFVGVLKAWIK